MGEKSWRVKKADGNVYGPADTDTIKIWIKERRISPQDLIRPEGGDWKPAIAVLEFTGLFQGIGGPSLSNILCPNCGKEWPGGTILCTQCGTDLRTGEKIKGVEGEIPSGKPPSGERLLAFQLVSDGWQVVRKNIPGVMGATLALALVLIILLIPASIFVVIPLVGFVVPFLVIGPLMAGWHAYCLMRVRGEEVGVREVFSGFQIFGPALLTTILLSLILGFTNIIPILGMFLFMALSLTYFLVVDKGLSPLEAIKGSFILTRGYRWRIMAVGSLSYLINIIGALCLGIGLLLTIPIQFIALASLYDRLLTGRISESQKKTSPWEIALALLLPLLIAMTVLSNVGRVRKQLRPFPKQEIVHSLPGE